MWAPNARNVRLTGDFNKWNGSGYEMDRLGSSGIWEIFVPGLDQGQMYKFEILTCNNEVLLKSDPYGIHSELRPGNASIVFNNSEYAWKDETWIKRRGESDIYSSPFNVYEVHLGSWMRNDIHDGRGGFLNYREIADKLIPYVKDMGYTHIELLPVAEHPLDDSWGYQITGYYCVTSRFGDPSDFKYFVDRCHCEDIGVIMDWVPAHFPKDAHGLGRFDGTALYEHENPLQGEHPEWGTYVFNYSRSEVKNFLVSNAIFWLEEYHIDGLRVDAVTSMIYLDYGRHDNGWIKNKWGGRENVEAIEFIKYLNTIVFKYFPGVVTIAEESTSWPFISKPVYLGGLGFSFKWNMGWMNDYLKYISMDPVYRKYNHNYLTFSIMYALNENYVLVLSHDEVVYGKRSMIAKMPGEYDMKFAGLRAAYGFMYGHPGKKLLFMGSEFGQFNEWDFHKGLDWNLLDYPMHRALRNFVRDLNKLYLNEEVMYESDYEAHGFEWIDCKDTDRSIVSFIRRGKDKKLFLLFVCNFTPVHYDEYRIGSPIDGIYKEIFNSDSKYYGGSNLGNLGEIITDKIAYHNKPFSMKVNIPPFGFLVFKPEVDVSLKKPG